MAAENVKAAYRDALNTLGKAGLNAIYPNDFEYYMVALELVDSQGNSVDYFAWPVMPRNIRESQPEINNVKKTAGGVVVIDNDSFIPTEITLGGTFGRSFKFIFNKERLSFAGFRLSGGKIEFDRSDREFSSFAKTGYGCIKAIEQIKKKSRKLDSVGKAHKLILYNPVLGNNYIVKFVDFIHYQEEGESNMMPNYEMVLRSIGRVGEDGSSLLDLALNLGGGVVQRAVNNNFSAQKSATKFLPGF